MVDGEITINMNKEQIIVEGIKIPLKNRLAMLFFWWQQPRFIFTGKRNIYYRFKNGELHEWKNLFITEKIDLGKRGGDE